MPLCLDDHAAEPVVGGVPPDDVGTRPAREADAERHCIDIGLVNNMPDSALLATERQFATLLAAASGRHRIRLHRLSLPTVARGDAAAAHIQQHYVPFKRIADRPLRALIVTGCEPRAASLRDEPYWDNLRHLVDWAECNTVSTLWSCLAAHAAVLHLDGIERRRLPHKRSGVFAFEPDGDHPLLAGASPRIEVPHSRLNDLAAADLRQHGYQVLTASADAGVDLFVRQGRSAFVFFQGHPEYEPDSIAREYRRDVSRFLRGERADYPALPQHYFDRATRLALGAFEQLAMADSTALALRDLPRQLGLRDSLATRWQATVLPIFRNWIDGLAEAV
ncbi:homoserine O-succinyltransferase [Lichenihabitans sp. PAMC28606]|uniref:homoserine O-succinyltransferase MetA n=1 Tax=Lichenihabitans sp. PAMC28606 TaxID=2880932 RepID=UPI001D0B4A9F|nr:homoserine O-succinyltransferase [Lichenihabitans sp. PAMC28606]UDL93209.1 homoserine O-succinyltransferase [Lichenihabitans sp. PAMC28606]